MTAFRSNDPEAEAKPPDPGSTLQFSEDCLSMGFDPGFMFFFGWKHLKKKLAFQAFLKSGFSGPSLIFVIWVSYSRRACFQWVVIYEVRMNEC